MKVLCDNQGFVRSFAFIGDLIDGIEVPEPEDIAEFIECAAGYKIVDGVLVKDDAQISAEKQELQKAVLRERREKECFPVINRGYLWYSGLNIKQWLELKKWYLSWLNVTDTFTVPDRPDWLDEFDASKNTGQAFMVFIIF
nr:MAG TPA: hypothetical protein [Caudoviricetes sp.]